ncbi:hypothetical protein Gotur_007694 [Gossypium turneri]
MSLVWITRKIGGKNVRPFGEDASFEKLGNCVRENETRVSFDLAVHKPKARSLLASKYKFDSVNSLHNSR